MFAFIAQIKLTWRLMRDRRVPLLAKALPVLALIYLVWPLDLIPDFLVVLGQLDDISVLLAAMRAVERMSPPEVVAEHRDILGGRRREGDRIIVTDYTVKKKK